MLHSIIQTRIANQRVRAHTMNPPHGDRDPGNSSRKIDNITQDNSHHQIKQKNKKNKNKTDNNNKTKTKTTQTKIDSYFPFQQLNTDTDTDMLEFLDAPQTTAEGAHHNNQINHLDTYPHSTPPRNSSSIITHTNHTHTANPQIIKSTPHIIKHPPHIYVHTPHNINTNITPRNINTTIIPHNINTSTAPHNINNFFFFICRFY